MKTVAPADCREKENKAFCKTWDRVGLEMVF